MSEAEGVIVKLGYRRLVRPGEWPVFGSVWTWGTHPDAQHLMVLSIERGDLPLFRGKMVVLDLDANAVDRGWVWISDRVHVDPDWNWYCIDEGLPGAPHLEPKETNR